MGRQEISIRVLPHGEGLPLPSRESEGAAGFDLRCALPEGETIRLAPGMRALIPAGFAMALPEGFEAQIRPRSGLALKHGVTVLNAPGTIDADYRGEVKVLLVNLGQEPFAVRRGDRIAQLVIARFEPARFLTVASLEPTARGAGGFGSTGAD